MFKWICTITLAVLLVTATGCEQSQTGQKPADDVTKTALSQFLRGKHAKKRGVSIDGPTNVRVGAYNTDFKGWEVYGDFKINYIQDGIRMSHSVEDESTPVAYARTGGDHVLCFVPKIFQEAQKKVEEDLQKEIQALGAQFQ